MELTDSEVQEVFAEIVRIQERYKFRTASRANLDSLQDEVLTKLHGMNVLASFDPTPLLNGEPPIVEIVGKIRADDIHKYGFDHEREYWEVQRANERGQDVYHEKE